MVKVNSYIALAFCLLAGVASDEIFKAGRPVGQSRQGRADTPVTVCTANNVGQKFCNKDGRGTDICDATQVKTCEGAGRFSLFTLDCPAAKPHCVEPTPGEATCSSVKDGSCLPTVDPNGFQCTGKGVFPDPTDCKKYYFCYVEDPDTSTTLKFKQYTCENLYVFDPSAPKEEYCRLTYDRFCTTITEADCTANAATNFLMKYFYFPKAKGQLVATCRGAGKVPYIWRCDAGFEADLNTLPVECKIVCTRADRKPNPGDDTKYYECVYDGVQRKWVGKPRNCFPGWIFDAKTKLCKVKS